MDDKPASRPLTARLRIGAIGDRARAPILPALRRTGQELVRASSFVRPTLEAIATTTSGGGWWLRTFLAFVVAPTFVFFLYAALWQSNGYEAEARITVRGAQEFKGSTTDVSGIISRITGGGGAAKATIQDSYIVLNYIKSTAILQDLGGDDFLEKYYSKSKIDYISRLTKSSKIEALLKYWMNHVQASVDTVSGILTLKVEAFSPQDASAIARDIIRLSERLINDISERSRKDAVARAEQEVSHAADKLAQTRDKLTVFRDKNALIDPGMRAKNIAELIAKLTLDKVNIESALTTLQGSLRGDSPTQRIQRDRLAAIDRQIDALNKALTNPNSNTAVSAQIATYERLKLDEQFDELMYKISMSSYERARQELERQQLYLVTVTPPIPPQEATYPKVVASTLLLFAALFIFWSIGALIAASINDQMI